MDPNITNLKEEIAEWPEVAVSEQVQSSFNPVSLAELLAREYQEPAWLVEQLVPSDGVTIMGGAPAVCKTWTYLHMAVAVATGQKLFDQFNTTQGGVLIVDEDNGYRELQKRLKIMNALAELPIHFLSQTGFKLSDVNNTGLLKFVKDQGVKLVIFDPLVRVHNGEENDSKSMSDVYTLLLDFVKAGAAVLCVHHNRKPGLNRGNPAYELRGSSDILASAFCHLALERQREDKNRIILTQTKLRSGQELEPLLLQVVADDNSFRLEYGGAITKGPSKIEQAQETILEILANAAPALCKKDIRDQAEQIGKPITDTTFKYAVTKLKSSGSIFTKCGPRRKEWYSLQPIEEVTASETEPLVQIE